MNNMTKLIGVAAVGASIAKAKLAQRFIKGLAATLSLAIATGIMAGALLIGVFYIAYQGLIHYGLDPLASQILLAILAAFVVVVLMSLTSYRLHLLRNIPAQVVHSEFPFASRLNGLADSFLDGLLYNDECETAR